MAINFLKNLLRPRNTLPSASPLHDIHARRFDNNPLIIPQSARNIGDNINGPSVIRVPGWLSSPLGKYYMYFAHHSGDFIRLAYADLPEGPWTVFDGGTLHLDDARAFKGHIASPDVHIVEETKQIRMYFHGPAVAMKGQKTGVAHSDDGVHFTADETILGKFYFRVWKWKDHFYALSKKDNAGWCEISRSADGISEFKDNRNFLKRGRHVAVHIVDDLLLIFFTRVGDAPERILATCVDMRSDWKAWRPARPVEILRPEADYEGIEFPVGTSRNGLARNVRQLRDPCLFADGNELYLYYCVAGESGIAGARISLG